MGVFESAGTSIDNVVGSFVTATSSNMISGIAPLMLAGVTLYLTFYGYLVMFGHIQEPASDLFKKCSKIVLIVVFALGAGAYQSNVIEAFRGLENGLSTIVQNGVTKNIYQVLDNSFLKGMLLAQTAYDNSNNASILTAFGTVVGWFLSGIIVSLGTILITVVAAGYIFLAKVALSMLLGIGPIFIMCLLFPPVMRFFDTWAGQVITYILIIVLMSTGMAFALTIFDSFVSQINFNALGNQNMISVALQLLALTTSLLIVIFQIPTIASALGGGFGLSMLNPLTPVRRFMRGARNVINPIRTRRDMRTGHLESASRLQHMRSGNTALNPAYSRRLYDNMRCGWGGWNRTNKVSRDSSAKSTERR